MKVLLPAFVGLGLAIGGCAPPRSADIGESQSGLTVCAQGATVTGVDVSHYDGTIDWAKAHAAGVDFAIMKATEGTNFTDPTFTANWANAGANGVIRGAYHFFHANVDPVAQAEYFVQQSGMPQPGDLPPTIDLEVDDGMSGADVSAAALTFLDHVKTLTGRTPIIYTSPSFFNSTLGAPGGFGGYVLWIAHWQVACPNVPSPTWSDWSIWQTDDMMVIDGINGNSDVDTFNGSLAELQAFVNASPTSTADLANLPAPSDMGQAAVDFASGGFDAASAPDAGGGVVHLPGPQPSGCELDGRPAAPPYALAFLLLAFAYARRSRRGASSVS